MRGGPIADAEVQLWLAKLDDHEESIERLSGLLDADERRRAARFRFPVDAARFVVGRASLRVILGALLSVDPGQLRLVYGPNGKPELDEPFAGVGLRFNLSHSDRLVLCAVTRGRRVGVDVERVRPLIDWEKIAERMFTPGEAHHLRLLSEAERSAAFFTAWTRHEARVKGHGERLDRARDLAEAEGWTVQTLTPAPDYVATVAVEGPISPLIVRTWSSPHA